MSNCHHPHIVGHGSKLTLNPSPDDQGTGWPCRGLASQDVPRWWSGRAQCALLRILDVGMGHQYQPHKNGWWSTENYQNIVGCLRPIFWLMPVWLEIHWWLRMKSIVEVISLELLIPNLIYKCLKMETKSQPLTCKWSMNYPSRLSKFSRKVCVSVAGKCSATSRQKDQSNLTSQWWWRWLLWEMGKVPEVARFITTMMRMVLINNIQ